ncbi:MAG: hypothetical protein NTU81_00840 [Candidatus Nomurabacteria bacterium]|nr:hypothetical protein [Candidatus Nomurabacteria bacterium]
MKRRKIDQLSVQELIAIQVEILQDMQKGKITPSQMKWFSNLSYECREELLIKPLEKEMRLGLIPGSDFLKIDAVDGTLTLENSKHVFPSFAKNSCNILDKNKSVVPTPETTVEIYGLIRNSNYSQMFGSLNSDLDCLCLTQHQIKNFCKKYPDHLGDKGNATFFLFKNEKKYFVANVYFYATGLTLRLHHFDDHRIWEKDHLIHIVVPNRTV